MKNRLKFIGASALVLVLALCGCGKNSNSKSSRDSESRSDSKSSFQSRFKPAVMDSAQVALGVNLDKNQFLGIINAYIDTYADAYVDQFCAVKGLDDAKKADIKEKIAEIKKDPFKIFPANVHAFFARSGLNNAEFNWAVLSASDSGDGFIKWDTVSLAIAANVKLEKCISAIQTEGQPEQNSELCLSEIEDFFRSVQFRELNIEGVKAWRLESRDGSPLMVRGETVDPYVTSLDDQLIIVALSDAALMQQIRLYRDGMGKGKALQGFSAANGEFLHLFIPKLGKLLRQVAQSDFARPYLDTECLDLDVTVSPAGTLTHALALELASENEAAQLRQLLQSFLEEGRAAKASKDWGDLVRMFDAVKIGGSGKSLYFEGDPLLMLAAVLYRYVKDAKIMKERRYAKQIADQQSKARQELEMSTKLIQGVYDEYHTRFLKAQTAVAEAARKVQAKLPEEMKAAADGIFTPPMTKELLDAIASTNVVAAVAAPPPAVAALLPAATEKPVMPLPATVKKYKAIWEDLCKCQAADIKLHKRMNELLEKAREANDLTAQNKETAEALSQLANDLGSGYSALDGPGTERWLRDARIKLLGLEKRAAVYSKEAIEKIENVIRRRWEEEVKKAAAEKAAAEKAAAEERHKELIAKEQAKAQEVFDGLLGEIKGLKWERCTSRLTRRREQMKTREGEAAIDSALKKVAFMEGVHKYFIQQTKGFRFKGTGGALLATVTETDDKTLTFQKMKYEKGKYVPDTKSTRVTWEDFYALKDQDKRYSDFKNQFLSYMDQLISELVIKGRERENTKLSTRERSEHMLGVALTLKLLLGDKPGVDKLIPTLVKEAVTEKNENEKRKGFGPNRKWAAQWFPEVELPEAEDL